MQAHDHIGLSQLVSLQKHVCSSRKERIDDNVSFTTHTNSFFNTNPCSPPQIAAMQHHGLEKATLRHCMYIILLCSNGIWQGVSSSA